MPNDPNDSEPDSSEERVEIQQNIFGNKDQVIGKVLGGTVVNFAPVINLLLGSRIPEMYIPPRNSVEKPLTKEEKRYRQALLAQVKQDWIKGVLENSLQARVSIALGLQKRIDLVQRPSSGAAESLEAIGQSVPVGTNAIDVFDQIGVGRTLLILGEPGSGKTITLLKLAEGLITRTEASGLQQPIPLVLNLSSWASKQQPIEQWLVQELLEKYHVSEALGKAWVQEQSLILLLDGLDEVKAEHRNACVQVLNHFMQTHGTTEIVICSRIQDYQALTDQLRLRSAICIQPLTSEQIDDYFEQAGEQLSALKTVLRKDSELQGLATSPLMLSIMSLAYQGCAIEEVAQGGTTEEYRKRLFDNYIDRMFQRRGTAKQYNRQSTQRWLIWLAQRMTAAAQTVFLIERLQPSWLLTKGQRFSYRLGSSLVSGTILGLITGLFFGLIYDLNVGLVAGLFFCLFGVTIIIFLTDIQPVETLKWSWKEAKKNPFVALFSAPFSWLSSLLVEPSNPLFGGLFLLLIIGFLARLTKLIVELNDPRSGLILVLTWGVFLLIIGGLIGGFRGPEIQQKGKPNQGIHQSVLNAAYGTIAGLAFGLFSMLVNWLQEGLSADALPGSLRQGLIIGLTFGLICGLTFGGSAFIQHFVLRFMLYRKGYAPWDYPRFLDYATERLFIQKVGGGYIFVHRLLLEHFAGMKLEQEKL